MENVREFEVGPNERGETHSARKNSSSLFLENENSADTILNFQNLILLILKAVTTKCILTILFLKFAPLVT